MLSDRQREIYEIIRDTQDIPETLPKLIPNLHDKTNYVVHYRNLQLYTSLGMIVKKDHKILSFEQSAWLKIYIDLTHDKKQWQPMISKNEFFKLMNKSMFGKTMENLRNRQKVDLVNSKRRLKKLQFNLPSNRSPYFTEIF